MTTEALDAPFWEAASEGRLVVQRCRQCSTAWWPAIQRCGSCDDGSLEWVEVPPEGQVWSYAVYHRLFDPSLNATVPYVVVAVELEAGVCLPGRFVDEPGRLTIGTAVEAAFVELEDGLTAPVWSVKATENVRSKNQKETG